MKTVRAIYWLAAMALPAISCRSESATNATNPTVAATDAAAATNVGKPAGRNRWGESFLKKKPDWYASAEAVAVADTVIEYQSAQGGWPKSTDLTAQPTTETLDEVQKVGRANTIDNNATTVPMQFLALMAQATGDEKYRRAFDRGLDYLLAAQYPNGGWPQFFPLRDHGYYSHITFNDGAMMNVMYLLRDAADGKAPYEFLDKERRAQAAAAVAKGIDCILRTQIKEDGMLTVWCAQYDEKTLEPAWARNFEPPSLSGAESVEIVRFLMGEQHPTPAIIAAVEGAVAWFKAVAIPGLRYQRGLAPGGQRDGWVVADPSAELIWARFYEIDSNRPIFVGRDKVIHYSYGEVERERRGGYDYYGDWPAKLLDKDYSRWREKNKMP